MELEHVFLTDEQLKLLGHAAEGVEIAAIAEQLGRNEAEVRAELSEIQVALGARSAGEAVLFAADRAGLRATDALAADVAAARESGPLPEPLRLLVRAMAAGATPEALARLLGTPRPQALRLAVLAGLHRPSLTEAELDLLRHAARGHPALRCTSECGLPGTTPIDRQRTAIVRKLRVPDMTAAVALAIRDLGLEELPEFAEQIARLRRDGLLARVREVVRDVSLGATRAAIAEARGLTVSQIDQWFADLSAELGLASLTAGMRSLCTVAIVTWANPGDPDPVTLEPALDDTAVSVLHWVALGYDGEATAEALGVPASTVRRAHRNLYAVFGARDLWIVAARATKLGVLTLPSTQDEPRRMLREQPPYPEELNVCELILEGMPFSDIAARNGWSVSLVQSTISSLRDSIGVGTTINALVLMVEAGLVNVPGFTLELDPHNRPLRKAPGTSPEPWATLESARGGSDDRQG